MKVNTVIEMFEEIANKIESEKDYITELDSILGDGDHWVNINKGYQKILSMKDQLAEMSFDELFKSVGMNIMSTVGGSSGILYGDAFMKASTVLKDVEDIDLKKGHEFLEVALNTMMSRGKAQPGDKTMIDPLHVVVMSFGEALKVGSSKEDISRVISKAAEQGMLDTKDMAARKGRATYREDKGVGYIDAGAATMCYQLDILGQYIGK